MPSVLSSSSAQPSVNGIGLAPSPPVVLTVEEVPATELVDTPPWPVLFAPIVVVEPPAPCVALESPALFAAFEPEPEPEIERPPHCTRSTARSHGSFRLVNPRRCIATGGAS